MNIYNRALKTVTPYVAGKPIEELARESGLSAKQIIKLASNENPLGPSPMAVRAIEKQLAGINRYPDSNYYELKKKVATKLNLGIESLVFGNGSDELIDCVIKGFSEPGNEVLSAKSTFLEYEIIAKVNNRKFKAIGLKRLRYDLDSIAKAITKKTRLVFIANPNNPTGTYVTKNEAEKFLKKIPSEVVVVFDEAYNEFVDTGSFPDTLKYVKNYNVIILRTFSKIYGLAGLRIGFAVTRPEFAEVLNTVRQPFNVNSLAAAAAQAAIDDYEFVKKTQELIWQEKEFLYKKFIEIGIKFIPSAANFILIEVAPSSEAFFAKMLKLGIIVRGMSAYGLKDYIRLTIGTHDENLAFLEGLKTIKEKK